MTIPRCPVIALTSSVGGLAATSYVLAHLPRDLPAAVVTVQHITPDAESRLPEIYASATTLPVVAAASGQVLEAGRVHVAPPGQHTLVTGEGRLALIASGAFPPSRPSADLLLVTLAMAVREAAIAVVLTGGGTDAAVGAAVVRSQGGAVLATDEASSENFSMPAATIGRDDTRPEVMALHEVPARLVELAHRAAENLRA